MKLKKTICHVMNVELEADNLLSFKPEAVVTHALHHVLTCASENLVVLVDFAASESVFQRLQLTHETDLLQPGRAIIEFRVFMPSRAGYHLV